MHIGICITVITRRNFNTLPNLSSFDLTGLSESNQTCKFRNTLKHSLSLSLSHFLYISRRLVCITFFFLFIWLQIRLFERKNVYSNNDAAQNTFFFVFFKWYSEYMCVIGPVWGIWCHHLVRQLVVFLSKSVSQTKVAAGEIQPRGLLLLLFDSTTKKY